ncbi:methyltransferase [Alkalimonas collagenimarina]|uniref:Ribosomal RNA small subunit methyltransferase C n=1 Tax=Alkalimonas collagenimarina TaxID=400390 RepID=A0ABT9GV07_9GAMM|nr:methyltransferase [Alkalimonas collagenimarina]MDP4534888.1 methyltransferase [Alkalimonas collagenimarina]
MLTTASQMLLRNLADLKGNTLLVEPPLDPLASQLPKSDSERQFSVFTSQTSVAANWQGARVSCSFGIKADFSQPFQTAVLFYPKSKEQFHFMLQQVSPVLADDCDIFVVGDNKSGIKTLSKQAATLGMSAHKLDNARHALWFLLAGKRPTGTPSISEFSLEIQGQPLQICSMPGVFNHGALDPGTALLLQQFTSPLSGSVLDFACGCGVIGAWLKQNNPSIELIASDVSALAVAATEATLAANQLTGTVIAADGLPTSPAVFDHMVTNPPFHTGLKTDYSIAEAFIRDCPKRIKTGGSLTLVANTHLPYKGWLEASFGHCTILAKSNGFTVYQCIQRKKL